MESISRISSLLESGMILPDSQTHLYPEACADLPRSSGTHPRCRPICPELTQLSKDDASSTDKEAAG